ncbi:hypothetical protein MPDQ_007632 [Monascus purpureus]|uniref:SNARE-complex protein Syntaxin-18 N-terminal domain-containing protein n=1 Tax=Monascus purpureus TaxID=5098 RepID=A0A507QVX3_MONPU|nr:hypothetical protein MPDQ_007632 [Monascus purpureus]UZG77111.1 SNARE protein [Monascus ruber]BDD58091.1 hypothetical protein MAP00_003398 [Monascus purpureus]
MTDLTPVFREILSRKPRSTESAPTAAESPSNVAFKSAPGGARVHLPSAETADEFLKEAYRINSHINSLLSYLHSIRHSYLSITRPKSYHRRGTSTGSGSISSLHGGHGHGHGNVNVNVQPKQHLTDQERDSIDSSTALLLRDLSSSIETLSSAESLRQETEATLLRKKYGYTKNLLWRWAGGAGASSSTSPRATPEQVQDEEVARTISTFREGVVWFLRRGLERAMKLQGGMVERRIERAREREKSVLYMNRGGSAGDFYGGSAATTATATTLSAAAAATDSALSRGDIANIESQLSPEQLQLFAEENDIMLRQYEDTLGKVQNAEKSLLEIASLQQTLVAHLATQEDYIGQLVADAVTMETNISRGNKELRRASERRSTAQAVFWGTVGLCTWLVFWDLVF